MNVVALAGGVGGAKLVYGLLHHLNDEELTVVVNTADDFEHLGLRICPDIDTVTYTVAGVANPETGWGRQDESWEFFSELKKFGGPTWFQLGDRDLALHAYRTQRLGDGVPLSQVTAEICDFFSVGISIIPMTDDRVQTIVMTAEGDLPFQEYFVARAFEPVVYGFRFEGIHNAQPAPGVFDSIQGADIVVLCPSNPWVSLDPILGLEGVREILRDKTVVGVSPIVRGRALKGPAAKMYKELGIEPSAIAVAEHYQDLLNLFIIDEVDFDLSGQVTSLGMDVRVLDTIMKNEEKKVRLAGEILQAIDELVLAKETK